MRFHSKKTVAIAAALTIALGGGVAYAYWTQTGHGTATAGVGTDVALVVTQTSFPAGLYPGGPAQAIDFSVQNPNAAAELVTSAVITITGTSNVGCTAADFTVVSPVVNQSIAGLTTATITGGSIAMINSASDQNACKNATVNLDIDVS